MKQYDSNNLVIHPDSEPGSGILVEVSPEVAGWETLWFQARRLEIGQVWDFEAGGNELALVILGGQLQVSSNRGRWPQVGRRANVFAGLPHALYLPPGSSLTARAITSCEFAVACVPARSDHKARLITPAHINVEIRGGDHATRQINYIIPPGFFCERLVVVEVYTPGGNWSSYPPHKHDRHRTGDEGDLVEADLDEIYYYRFDRPGGYAVQRIYTGQDSPLACAGFPIDAAVTAHENDVVLIPEGYHPVSSPVGYTTYYLNVLAGSAQSLAASDDPEYAWIKGSYRSRDPRVPVYDVTEARKL
ncbi:MAG TPA: 5-deoxy-glucuronate isomerase [Acidobacteriota bacterium]|nr:5-deoxy-glucuronate isomerase [Acidobacteriota bacterium]